MPFIHTHVSTALTPSQEETLKEQFGRAIACIPGKTEEWLMLEFEDSRRMWFRGSREPMAMVDVSLFGGASDDAYEKLTARLTAILEEVLGLSPQNIYVKYSEYSHWGWNGGNF
ncbi:MAG TPA: tautomerase family protein [Candidatus Merdivicinus intestinavium]|nr:tautomerase family protein [Candidatus Merdivicinus intestinavium]